MNEKNGSVEAGDEINLISLIQLVWNYRLLVGGVTAIFTGFALWLALTTPFVYRTEVVVTAARQGENPVSSGLAARLGGLASLAGLSSTAGGSSEDAQAMLNSRYLAEKFIASRKLVGKILGAGSKQSLWLAAERFRQKNLSIRLDKETATTRVSVTWKDPSEAAEWANEYVALANEIMRNRALAESSRNINFLNEQIAKTPIVEIQRVMYGLIETETKDHMLASTRTEYAFTVIDPAVAPEERVWPRRSIIAVSGAAFGFLLGALLAWAYDFWRRNWNRVL